VLNTAVGNPAMTTLWRSTLVMLIGWLIGRMAGAVMYRVVLDFIERHETQNPIPEENAPSP
jgi:hypothetical protein